MMMRAAFRRTAARELRTTLSWRARSSCCFIAEIDPSTTSSERNSADGGAGREGNKAY